MTSSLPDLKPQRLTMRHFFWLPLGGAALLVLALLVGLVVMSSRSLDRLQPVQAHLEHISRIQDVGLSMEQSLLKGLRGVQISAQGLNELQRQLKKISGIAGAMHPLTEGRLADLAQQLGDARPGTMDVLFEALAKVRGILKDERGLHDELLKHVADSTRTEHRLALILVIVLPVAGAVGVLFLQKRVEQPLKDLQILLDRLSGRDFLPVAEAEFDQLTRFAQPAFRSYNQLVSRLQELEAEHEDRERLLEQRVREATEALLAQSRELSRAERLAAVGAVSAGLAHELRNPLAGIQLACSKLKSHQEGEQDVSRLAAVIKELKRINHLLTEQVDAARHAPEPMVTTEIGKVVGELLGLLRYQIPSDFELQANIPGDMLCMLPAASLRQALLNLVLNAVQVQGDAGRVAVSADRAGSRVVLHVSDDGPGFPEEMLRVGIRPFATGRKGGTGLGLTMVRRFVRELDGELELENRSPHGARVSMVLPCNATSDAGVNGDA